MVGPCLLHNLVRVVHLVVNQVERVGGGAVGGVIRGEVGGGRGLQPGFGGSMVESGLRQCPFQCLDFALGAVRCFSSTFKGCEFVLQFVEVRAYVAITANPQIARRDGQVFLGDVGFDGSRYAGITSGAGDGIELLNLVGEFCGLRLPLV